MAVSLSSGYGMRSDFMISDAALPQRLEEAQAADFAELIAQTDAVSAQQTAALVKEQSVPDDPKVLAQMVSDGELKLEDIPEELMTVELKKLIEALAEMRGERQPVEEEKPDDDDADMMMNAAAFVQTDFAADMTAELGEIAKSAKPVEQTAPTETVKALAETYAQPAEHPQSIPRDIPEQAQQTGQTEQLPQEEFAQIVGDVPEQAAQLTQEAPEQAQTVRPEQSTPARTSAADAEKQTVQPETEQQVTAATQAEADGADSTDSGQLSGQQTVPTQAAQRTEPKTDIPKDTEFTVEVKQPAQEEIPPVKAAQDEMQTGAQAGQSRVTAASDELEMLRSAVKKPDDARTEARAETPLMQDTPVVFRAESGRTVEVKPSEMAQQVTERLIDAARSTQRGETEYTMTLNPEELGKITVKLTKAADGAVSVTIAAENSRTRELLEQNSALMQDNLRTGGMKLESWQTVNESQHENHAQDYNGSSKNPYYRSETPQHDDGEAEGGTFAELIASM